MSDFFDSTPETSSGTGTLKHYKTIILENIIHDSDPNDYHIKRWIKAPHLQIKRLLKDMEREGLITIQMVNDRGCVRRILTPTGKGIDTI